MKIIKASIKDIDLLAPLFDLYRQFYKQESDLNSAKNFLTERVLVYNEDEILMIPYFELNKK